MILILICLIALAFLGVWGCKRNSGTVFGDVICFAGGALGFIGLFICAALLKPYFAAEHKANIINREYGTNYTPEEVFYASSVINTVREIDRKRIELNGDLMKKD